MISMLLTIIFVAIISSVVAIVTGTWVLRNPEKAKGISDCVIKQIKRLFKKKGKK